MSIQSYRNIHPRISESAYIADSADVIGNVVIGSQVTVGYRCILFNFVLVK